MGTTIRSFTMHFYFGARYTSCMNQMCTYFISTVPFCSYYFIQGKDQNNYILSPRAQIYYRSMGPFEPVNTAYGKALPELHFAFCSEFQIKLQISQIFSYYYLWFYNLPAVPQVFFSM